MDNFLERSLRDKVAIVEAYQEKVDRVEETKAAYEQAQEELEALGNIDEVKADIECLQSYLNPSAVEETENVECTENVEEENENSTQEEEVE